MQRQELRAVVPLHGGQEEEKGKRSICSDEIDDLLQDVRSI